MFKRFIAIFFISFLFLSNLSFAQYKAARCTWSSLFTGAGGTTNYLDNLNCFNVKTGTVAVPSAAVNQIDMDVTTWWGTLTSFSSTGNIILQSETKLYDMGNCYIESANLSAKIMTGVFCPGGGQYETAVYTGPIGPTGANGTTNVVLTISGYNLTNLSGTVVTGATVVNNMVDYSELTNSTIKGISTALVLILVLISVIYLIKGLFNKTFNKG